MVLQPLLGSAELLSYIRTNETVLSLVSSTCLLRNKGGRTMTGSFRFTSSDPAWILEALARSPLDARRDLRRAPDSAQTENHEDGESGIVGGTTGVVGRRIVSACLGRVASVS